MSEFLRRNPESFENEPESDPDIAELAVVYLALLANKRTILTTMIITERTIMMTVSTTRRMATMMIMARNVLTSMKKN